MRDQRKFPRANYPCSLTLWQDDNYQTIFANTSNISAGGLLVYLNESLMVGAKVEVKVDFSSETSFQCNGIVVRCQESNHEPHETRIFYAVAIAFEGLDQTTTAKLTEYVNKFLTYEKKN